MLDSYQRLTNVYVDPTEQNFNVKTIDDCFRNQTMVTNKSYTFLNVHSFVYGCQVKGKVNIKSHRNRIDRYDC